MRSIIIILFLAISALGFGQPQAFKYQSVVRNTAGDLLKNKNVSFQISLLKGIINGPAVYVEEHTAVTSDYGSVTLEIGRGQNPTSDFSSIDWASTSYFIQIAWDFTGGANYEIAGTSELLSVPYALNSGNAQNGFESVSPTGDTLYLSNGKWVIIPGLSAANEVAESTGTFTDIRDGNIYNFVTIYEQVWMAENLKYLPSVNNAADGSEHAAGSYYYVYGDDGIDVAAANSTSNYTTYGVLYNWTAAMASSTSSTANPSKTQGVCPAGWHLPSDAEWTQLIDYLGGASVAGGKLKETGTKHWTSYNPGATNETGFTALPGGKRYFMNNFESIGYYGSWWSATEYDAERAWGYSLTNSDGVVYRGYSFTELGYSVRCVRD